MDIETILREMTLEEKASLCQGSKPLRTTAVPRLGVPSIAMAEGAHGLCIRQPGLGEPSPAVCFPAASGLAASFDRDLSREVGSLIGQSALAEHLELVLGPPAGVTPSPLSGRNAAFFSEDPLLSAETAAAWVRGVQAQGVGAALKVFAGTHPEAVNQTDAWALVFSRGEADTPGERLRDGWNDQRPILADSETAGDGVRDLEAGLDLLMPRDSDAFDRMITEAVRSGRLRESVLDAAVRRVLTLVQHVTDGPKEPEEFDWGMQHHQARKIARETMVLLKNDGGLLPITGNKKVAFIGAFAEQSRFQLAGSGRVRCTETLSALQAVRSVSRVTYARGFPIDRDEPDPDLEAEAVRIAAEADIAVLFLGLPDAAESEGPDRRGLSLPACQDHLVEAVAAVQPRVAVVLHNGGPVEMPWIQRVPAVLEAGLSGQAAGGAMVDLLFGAVSPCGKLAETFPLRLEDIPAFPGTDGGTPSGEDLYTGYRRYDKRGLPVLFPFGHGLTYTSFTYSRLRLSADRFGGSAVTASVDVTNAGRFPAKEIVQFYVRPVNPRASRPVRELKGYGKLFLAPGETGTVTVTLDRSAFAHWDEMTHGWRIEGGTYAVEAAASSRDIRCSADLAVPASP